MTGSDDDPFEEEGLEDYSTRRRGKARGDDIPGGPEDPGEGAELDRQLAGQLLNDFGNAQRLIARFGDNLLHVENNGWFAWDDSRWNRERGHDQALKRGHQTALAIWAEWRALKDKPGRGDIDDQLKRLARHAVLSGNTGSINAMLAAAAPYLSKSIDDLDADPLLVAAPNGTIELGLHCEFRAARRTDLLSRRLGVGFDTKKTCPRFAAFLERIMPDEEMRDFLQRIFGYCLSGSTREQVIFLFYGTGSNGKSTLMNVVREIMGDYAMVSPISTFLVKREGGSGAEASPDVARLPGARLVTAAEPPEGARLDEGKIKEMTGGEPLVARHLNQGFFTFRPVFKAIILTNHQPIIRGVDHGIWRRIRMVPFTVEIPAEEIDRDLEAKLLDEAPAILQWMLSGFEDYRERGLDPPAAAIAAVDEYRADQDPVGEFIKACCVLTGDKQDPATGELYEIEAKRVLEAYKNWCESAGLEPLSGRVFGTKMTARGIARRKSGGLTIYRGIVVRAGALV